MHKIDWNPGSLLDLSGFYWRSCVLHAAVKLDIFTTVGNETIGSEDLARKCNCSHRGMMRLLNAAVALGLLTKTDGSFANPPASFKFLSKDSDHYVGHIIIHHHQLMASWADLDQAVRTGRPVRSRASRTDDQWRESFLMGMFNMAMSMAPRVVPLIELKGCKHLLDLGGGPGTYAIHFCRANPDLEATVFDLPTTRPFAEKTIDRFGLSDRIAFEAGDFLEDNIGRNYDAAWLSHILHGEGPDSCQQIIGKVVGALNPGGRIIVHEFILDNTMDAPLFPTLFSLNMLLGTAAGQAYSQQQLEDMLAGFGVKNIERIYIESPNDSGIMSGVV